MGSSTSVEDSWKVERKESFPLVGEWVDSERNFFNGSVISVTKNSWRPAEAGDGATNRRYVVERLSNTRWNLKLRHGSGEVEIFHMHAGAEGTAFIISAHSGREWELK